MKDDVAVTTRTTRKERYKAIQAVLKKALLLWHPDHYQGTDPENSIRMTRKLLNTQKQVERLYRNLEDE